MNIKFLTNSNILLFHCIDYASQWDFHVAGQQRKYLGELLDLDKKDLSQLENYKEVRKELGWDAESTLFKWASVNFEENPKYEELLKVINYFKGRTLANSEIALQKHFENKVHFIENFIEELSSTQTYLHHKEVVDKLLDVFPLSDKELEITCYLPYTNTMNSVQGGANGDDIYLEVNEESSLSSNGSVVLVALHEYFHKVANIRKYLKEQRNEEDRTFFNGEEEYFHNTHGGMFDEFVAHVLSETVLGNVDIEDRLSKVEKNTYKWHIYRGTLAFTPIIKKYLEGNSSPEVCLEELIVEYKSLYKK